MSPPDSGKARRFRPQTFSCPARSDAGWKRNWWSKPSAWPPTSAGNSIAARIAMMAMTTSNSMSVNPARKKADGFRPHNFFRLFMPVDLTAKPRRTQRGNEFTKQPQMRADFTGRRRCYFLSRVRRRWFLAGRSRWRCCGAILRGRQKTRRSTACHASEPNGSSLRRSGRISVARHAKISAAGGR